MAVLVAASAAEPATKLWTEEAGQAPAKKEHWWERWLPAMGPAVGATVGGGAGAY